MFKRLRFIIIGILIISVAALAYHFLGNPDNQRKIAQKAEELKELNAPKRARWTGTVIIVEAVDGDKLLVNTETSPKVKVCLAGIDAPELGTGVRKGQPLAEESRTYLSELTTNKAAEMTIVGTDPQKHPIVLLQIDSTLVNAKMTEAGMAEVTTECAEGIPAKQRHLIENGESTARQAHLGIWGLTNYVRPVEFRLRQR